MSSATLAGTAPTRLQLENGARAISYRAGQLVTSTRILMSGIPFGISPPSVHVEIDLVALETIDRALIQSALGDACALAYFFARPIEVNVTMYETGWVDDVIRVAREVRAPVAVHRSHATTGATSSEEDPGNWPIPELAVALIGGLARFVAALDPQSDRYDPAWFATVPMFHAQLMALDPLATPTEISADPAVGTLTRALHQHLAEHDIEI